MNLFFPLENYFFLDLREKMHKVIYYKDKTHTSRVIHNTYSSLV